MPPPTVPCPSKRRLPAIALMTISLAACGGGGGPDTAAPPVLVASTINEANAAAVASDAYAVSSSVYGLSEVSVSGLVGASVQTAARTPDVIGFAYRQVERLASAPLPGGRQLAGAVVSESASCPGGGSVTIAADDADSDGQLSTGDSASFRFSACSSDGIVVDGTFALGDVVITGPAASPTGAAGTFTYTALRVTDGSFWTSVNGSARIATTIVTPSPVALAVRIEIPSLGYAASDGSSYTLSSFLATTTADSATDRYTLSVSGSTTDSTLGTLTLSTPIAFAGTIGLAPVSGQMRVAATDGSSLRLTALDASTARIEVDADGDANYESSTTRTWASLEGI